MDVGKEKAGARRNAMWEKNFHFIILCYRKGEEGQASLRKGWELGVKDIGSSDLPYSPPPPSPLSNVKKNKKTDHKLHEFRTIF